METFSRISQRRPVPVQDFGVPMQAQTREGALGSHSNLFNTYNPLEHNIDFYRTLREAVPFLDTAIIIRKLLMGTFEVETFGKEHLQKKINDFIDNVQVNWFSKGLWAFKDELHDSADESGMGFGETVLLESGSDIHRLKTCNAKDFTFVARDGRLWMAAYKNGLGAKPEIIEHPELVYYLAYDKRQGNPQGYSMLYSCVLTGQEYVKWMKSFGNYVWRFGDPTITVSIEAPEGTQPSEINAVRDSVFQQLANVFQKRRQGQTADLGGGIPGGKVTFGVLGADGVMQENSESVKRILEALVSKTGLPPYMLGLSWSSTERMSAMQADRIQSNIKQMRHYMEEILTRVIDTYLIVTNSAGEQWKPIWNDILLLDNVEMARANLFDSQSAGKTIENVANMIMYGWTTEQEATEYLREYNILKSVPPKGWFKNTQSIQMLQKIAKENLI